MHTLSLPEFTQQIEAARAFLERRFSPFPRIAVIAGTGLGDMGADLADADAVAYRQIPHFPASTVASHAGQLLCGRLGGRHVAVLQGRCHLYEGYSAAEVTFALRALVACGVQALIVTNAAGGLNPGFAVGDIMVIRDHINMTGENPLAGPHDDKWGSRFPDMTAAYDRALRQTAVRAAAQSSTTLREGVYVAVTGPSLETPAETRFYRLAGADAIGMSTVPEVIVAAQAGVRVLAFSVITNMNIPEAMQATALEDVLRTAGETAPRLARLIRDVLAAWPEGDPA